MAMAKAKEYEKDGKVDIYRRDAALEEYLVRCISKMHHGDQDSARRYLDDLLSNGFSARRVYNIASTLSIISREINECRLQSANHTLIY